MRMKVLPGSKNSRKPERKQQAPPPEMPVMKANLTPMEVRWLPMKGVTIKATRQLVPMISPYWVAVAPFISASLRTGQIKVKPVSSSVGLSPTLGRMAGKGRPWKMRKARSTWSSQRWRTVVQSLSWKERSTVKSFEVEETWWLRSWKITHHWRNSKTPHHRRWGWIPWEDREHCWQTPLKIMRELWIDHEHSFGPRIRQDAWTTWVWTSRVASPG